MDQAAADQVVDEPPEGADWLHEIKFDGNRMHARLDCGEARLLPAAIGSHSRTKPPYLCAKLAIRVMRASLIS
jgi:hypothetical protein